MATQIVPAPASAEHTTAPLPPAAADAMHRLELALGMSTADVAAHLAAQGPVRTTKPARPQRTVLREFPAGAPRGSWSAEEYAAERRRDGIPATVVMDLATDSFLVIVEAAS